MIYQSTQDHADLECVSYVVVDPTVAELISDKHTDTQLYTVSRKSELPKDFVTTCVNFHQIKYNFTHTHSHVFQTMF